MRSLRVPALLLLVAAAFAVAAPVASADHLVSYCTRHLLLGTEANAAGFQEGVEEDPAGSALELGLDEAGTAVRFAQCFD